MNGFVFRQTSNYIVGTFYRAFDLTANQMAASCFQRPPPIFVWSGYKRLRLTTVACSHRVALNGVIDMVKLSKMLKTLKLLQHFVLLVFTL